MYGFFRCGFRNKRHEYYDYGILRDHDMILLLKPICNKCGFKMVDGLRNGPFGMVRSEWFVRNGLNSFDFNTINTSQ